MMNANKIYDIYTKIADLYNTKENIPEEYKDMASLLEQYDRGTYGMEYIGCLTDSALLKVIAQTTLHPTISLSIGPLGSNDTKHTSR